MNSIYRCISAVCLFLELSFSVFFYFTTKSGFFSFYTAVSLLSSVTFIITLIFPERIEFLSFPAVINSIYFLFTESFLTCQVSLLFFVAACSLLFSRGYFRKYRWPKVIAATVFYLVLFCLSFAFKTERPLDAQNALISVRIISGIFLLAADCLLLFLIVLFYYLYLRNQGKSPIEKVLDLNQFTELSIRDKEWLSLILKETKYSTIASQYNVSLGTVKNRMRYIFDVIDVSDRIGFMATYGGYTLSF